jgi:dolichol-phosphate mannosyltransferase
MDIFCSIIITAYNEEKTILNAFNEILESLNHLKLKHEIIIVNDGSTDNTQSVIDKIINLNKATKSIENRINQGPGKSFTLGVKKSKGNVVIWLGADDEVTSKEYLQHISLLQNYDLITFYHKNPKARSIFRYLISILFTKILNFFFLANLKYYNGPTAMRKEIYLQLIPKSDRFFFSAECKLKAIKKGYINIQVPILLADNFNNKSLRNIITPLEPKNILDVFQSFFLLFWEIYFSQKYKSIKKIPR